MIRRISLALRRGYADLGTMRRDYSDPCFARYGHVHESFFGYTVRVKASKDDRRCDKGSSEFVSYSWATDPSSRIAERKRMKLAGLKVRDKRALLMSSNESLSSQQEKCSAEDEQEQDADVGISSFTGDSLEAIAQCRLQRREGKKGSKSIRSSEKQVSRSKKNQFKA